jgi:hypothetical protein
MATVKNLVIDQGTTFSLSISVSDYNGNSIDLAGYTLRSQLRKSYGAASYTSFTVTAADDTTTGELTISLSASETSALKAGRYVYDVEIVAPEAEDSTVTRVLEGIITVTPEVTR